MAVPSSPSAQRPPELRINPLTGEHVVVAAASSSRPSRHGEHGPCNLCPGSEHRAGQETDREGRGPTGWSARCWLNPWPIVTQPDGIHEVVALAAGHTTSLADLDDAECGALARLVERRIAAHAAAGWLHTQLFLNHGDGSGRSALHPHLQLIAWTSLPPSEGRVAAGGAEDAAVRAERGLFGGARPCSARDWGCSPPRPPIWCG